MEGLVGETPTETPEELDYRRRQDAFYMVTIRLTETDTREVRELIKDAKLVEAYLKGD